MARSVKTKSLFGYEVSYDKGTRKVRFGCGSVQVGKTELASFLAVLEAMSEQKNQTACEHFTEVIYLARARGVRYQTMVEQIEGIRGLLGYFEKPKPAPTKQQLSQPVKRGRPRKVVEVPKRKRGRPRKTI